MNIRTNRPIQFRITLEFVAVATGLPVLQVVDYGFSADPTAFKVKMVVRSIEQGILRSIPGLSFVRFEAQRIGA